MFKLTEKQDQLASICRRFGVRRLDLFGSGTGRAKRAFDSQCSDLDFVVQFDDVLALGPADQFFGLLEALEDLFKRKIDLVDDTAIRNPYFRQGVEATRQPLYDARAEKVAV